MTSPTRYCDRCGTAKNPLYGCPWCLARRKAIDYQDKVDAEWAAAQKEKEKDTP